MNFRRSLTFLVLALALLAPATAQADKAKPKSSTPKIFLTLTDGAMNKTTVKPTIKLTFDPPKGTTAAKACKGKITVSAPIGNKIVKKKTVTLFAHNVQQLTTVGGVCTASPTLKLPAAFLGQSVKFTAVFNGNDAVKKFKKTSRLLVKVADKPVIPTPTPPTPTPTPPAIHAGTWVAHFITGESTPEWTFEIKTDGSVSGITMTGGYHATCATGYNDLNAVNFSHPAPFTFVGDTASIQFHNSGAGLGGNHYNVATDFAFNLGPGGTGTGTVQSAGTFITSTTGTGDFDEAHCSFGPQALVLQSVAN